MHSKPPQMLPSVSFSYLHLIRLFTATMLAFVGASTALAQSTFDVSDTNGNFSANATWKLTSGSGTRPGAGDHIAITDTTLTANTEVAFPNDGTVASLVYGTAGTESDTKRSILFRGSGDNARTFTITGNLTKYDSGSLSFSHRGSSTGELMVSIGGNVTLHEGTLNFGGVTSVRYLSGLTIDGITQISGGTMNLHLSTNTSLGTLVVNKGTLSLNNGNVVNGNRTIQVRSLSGTGGTISESSTGTGATFTLAITGETADTATTRHTYAGAITNGEGTGTVALKKSGVATQILSGANTYEGGTSVDQGTLIVSGSLAANGDIEVKAQASFVAAASLEVGTVTLADGAILGFDLDQNGSLKINGDLAATGSFTIDFLNSGNSGQLYTSLFSITGTGADFGSVNFINFGAEGLAGQLTAAQLSGSFSIGNIPEPAHLASLLATGCIVAAFLFRHRRSRP